MTACTACGHAPLTGRYCSNCGVPAPSGGAHEPTSIGTPPPVRFPLYADEFAAPARSAEPATDTAVQAPLPPVVGGHHDPDRARPRLTPWQVGVGLVLLFAFAGGGLLLLGGGTDEPDQPGADDPATSPVEATEPDADGTGGAPVPPSGERLAPAEVAVPGTAPASQDNDGNPVTYEAANLFDDDPRTAWRVAGDASGTVLTFRFDEPVTVTDVGLINGYAKEDPPNDWYTANRRVLAVEWAFGDGTTVTQELTESREVQRMEIDAVETDVVELRLTEVSDPRSRDYTAISEVGLTGSG